MAGVWSGVYPTYGIFGFDPPHKWEQDFASVGGEIVTKDMSLFQPLAWLRCGASLIPHKHLISPG